MIFKGKRIELVFNELVFKIITVCHFPCFDCRININIYEASPGSFCELEMLEDGVSVLKLILSDIYLPRRWRKAIIGWKKIINGPEKLITCLILALISGL